MGGWFRRGRTCPLDHQPVCVKSTQIKAGKRALDLFCGQKSAARVLEKHGFQVETLDSDPKRDPSICVDILEWDFRSAYPPGYFHTIMAAPPCTEYSAAKWRPPRNPESADPVVKNTLEIIEYFQPEIWWLETPRNGLLTRRDFMQCYPWVDCDHCQFEDLGYQKPTRFFGSKHLAALQPILCDGHKCPSLEAPKDGPTKKRRRHRKALGGNQGNAKKEVTYYIPPELVEYVSGLESLSHSGSIGTPVGRVTAINGEEDADPFTLDPENLPKLERYAFKV